jgi:fucokinase
MSFMSQTLCQMASSFSSLRSGPYLNTSWTHAYELIQSGHVGQALVELSKERKKWMQRDDLIIRASRHYEGAMLALIRRATSIFYVANDTHNTNNVSINFHGLFFID